jgi:antitoxin component YwqK of YwqJK toxin-antitoxin module
MAFSYYIIFQRRLFFVIFELMYKAVLISLLIFGSPALHGQNLMDEQGRKTGHWKVEYPNGHTLYEADFVEGRPAGEMVRYYENSAVKARMVFEKGSDRSRVQLFYKNGKPAANGWYVNQLKDSVWTYYSEFDGSVRIREPYQDGKLDGISRSYYPSGQISEEVEWKQNVKDGAWNQYYQNGVLRLSGHYKNNLLNGTYEVYFSNGTIMMRGTYIENKSHGTWRYFDEKGNEIYALEYLNGAPADREKYDLWIQDTLMKLEGVSEPEMHQQF